MHLQLQSIALTFTSVEAATVKWVEWTTNTSVTLGAVGVTYLGELSVLSALNYLSRTPSLMFSDSAIVVNVQPPQGNLLQLFVSDGTGVATNTPTFSA